MTALGIRGTDLRIDIGGEPIVSDATIEARPGDFVGLVGPNGSGKTTLLRALARVLRPRSGTVTVGTDDIFELSERESARRIAVLQQHEATGFEFTVREIVSLGRLPHQRRFAPDSDADFTAVQMSLDRCHVNHLAERQFSTLSGGERQRALIARALAQEPRILLLDEPTNHLDIGSQHEVLGLVSSLGITTIAALHDLNQAAEYCNHIVVMEAGQVVAAGNTGTTLTAELVCAVYRVATQRIDNPITGRPHFAFAASSNKEKEPQQ